MRTDGGWRLDGEVVLVTGATSGIGRVTAAELGRAGGLVLVHGRHRAAAEATVAALAGTGGGRFQAVWGDLHTGEGLRSLIDQVGAVGGGRLHGLVNNAGAAFASREVTELGVERTIAVNHLVPALLTRALRDPLRAGADDRGRPSRVVGVSSTMERRGDPTRRDWSYVDGYRQFQAYCDAKLIGLAYTLALAGRWSDITVNAADPGSVATNFGRSAGGVFGVIQRFGRPLLAGPDRGARSSVRLAADPGLDGQTGGYYRSGRPAAPSRWALNAAYQERVWHQTEGILERLGCPVLR
jgi:NAD(P)-dependent dehydrogenase (short-subunit alcohol dehydrogenase family)